MEARALFHTFDSNSDGSLDMMEFSASLSDSGLTAHQIEALFFALDANADGKVLAARQYLRLRERVSPGVRGGVRRWLSYSVAAAVGTQWQSSAQL